MWNGGGSNDPWDDDQPSSSFPGEASQGYNLSQDSVGFGFSQGLLSQSQYSLSQLVGLSQQSQGLETEPTCTECQATEFSTTDQGDMVRVFLCCLLVVWDAAVCGTGQ